MRVWVILSTRRLCPGQDENHYKYEPSVFHQLSITNLDLLDVCALSRTSGHIPRYMSQTSNNKICQLIIHCVFCNSGRMNLAYDNVRYMAYR